MARKPLVVEGARVRRVPETHEVVKKVVFTLEPLDVQHVGEGVIEACENRTFVEDGGEVVFGEPRDVGEALIRELEYRGFRIVRGAAG